MTTDWNEVFKRRPDLAPPGYEEAVQAGQVKSRERYEQQGKRRAGKSGKSKQSQFPSVKHSHQD